MEHEFASTLTTFLCAGAYWLGGQELPYFSRGFKQVRRYAIPVIVYAYLVYIGKAGFVPFLACLGLSAALHMGYQAKLWKYAMTGLLMGIPALLIGPSNYVLLPMVTHLVLGHLSLKHGFPWSFVGLAQGYAIGICYTMV